MAKLDFTVLEIAKLPGVADIKPAEARIAFAKALKAEADGDKAAAQGFLDKAVATAA